MEALLELKFGGQDLVRMIFRPVHHKHSLHFGERQA